MKKSRLAETIKQVANTGQLAALREAVYGVRHCYPEMRATHIEVLQEVLKQAKRQGIPQSELDAVLGDLKDLT